MRVAGCGIRASFPPQKVRTTFVSHRKRLPPASRIPHPASRQNIRNNVRITRMAPSAISSSGKSSSSDSEPNGMGLDGRCSGCERRRSLRLRARSGDRTRQAKSSRAASRLPLRIQRSTRANSCASNQMPCEPQMSTITPLASYCRLHCWQATINRTGRLLGNTSGTGRAAPVSRGAL